MVHKRFEIIILDTLTTLYNFSIDRYVYMKNIALPREFYRFLGFSSRMPLHLTHNGAVNSIAKTLLESLNEGNISTPLLRDKAVQSDINLRKN